MQSDPIGLAGGMSTYGYVDASPLMSYDLLGLAATAMIWEGGIEGVSNSSRALGVSRFVAARLPVGAAIATGAYAGGYAGKNLNSWIENTFGSPGTALFDLINPESYSACPDGDESKPSAADCNKAMKLLMQVIRLSEKFGKKLPPKRVEELRRKINDGTIRSEDLPATLQQEFPASLRGKSLNEIRRICGK